MSATPTPQGKATYVASQLDKSWLLSEQRKLHERSLQQPAYVFCKLWGLVTDPRNLRISIARVAQNKGSRTAGVDGITVRKILGSIGIDAFVAQVRSELRSDAYRPSPVRRVQIPKPGQPGKFRNLGIPTVKDRVVQAAVKNIMEPIFEADFYPTSYGFRPGKGVHGALQHLRLLLRPRDAQDGSDVTRLPYQWAIEGDIKGCFDNISHHGLMRRIRRRVGDAKVNRLVVAFLKAGILAEEQFLRTDSGAPQGGILSPLLANIALCAIEERYERHVWPRRTAAQPADLAAIRKKALKARTNDKTHGRVVMFPIRYADDFIILVGAPPGALQFGRAQEAALQEKEKLAKDLKDELGLELSETKTLVTPVTKPIRFLGHHVRVRAHPTHGRLMSTTVVPKSQSQRLRELIKRHFGLATTNMTLSKCLNRLNPVLRGWGYFYRHAWGAKKIFSSLDHYVWWTIFRWLRKKHHRRSFGFLRARYGRRKPGHRSIRWSEDGVLPFELSRIRVRPYELAWMKTPDFASTSTESPVHNERCTPGSGVGAVETATKNRGKAPRPHIHE